MVIVVMVSCVVTVKGVQIEIEIARSCEGHVHIVHPYKRCVDYVIGALVEQTGASGNHVYLQRIRIALESASLQKEGISSSDIYYPANLIYLISTIFFF